MNPIRLKTTHRRLLVSILVILIGVLSHMNLVYTAFEKTFVGNLNQRSQMYLDETLKKAIYTYAVVRGINGIISVIQNTKVDVSPAGVGVSMALGEVLDPVNDLVERFSWVMLVSIAALGIQKILLSFGTWLGLNLVLSLSMVVLLCGIWIPYRIKDQLTALGYKMMAISFAVWLCVPVICLAGDTVYDLFLKETYDTATKSLDMLDKELKGTDVVGVHATDRAGDTGLIEDIKNYFNDAKQTLNIRTRLEQLKVKIADYVEYTIHLIVVFVSQTIIFPLLFLWLFVRSMGFFFRFGEKT